MKKINLDKICAEYGMKIQEKVKDADKKKLKELETVITNALGVLVEDGPFAFAIFLESRKGKNEPNEYDNLIELTKNFLSDESINLLSSTEKFANLSDLLLKITDDILKLILAKTLLEKMLIYARYKAKAMQREAGEE